MTHKPEDALSDSPLLCGGLRKRRSTLYLDQSSGPQEFRHNVDWSAAPRAWPPLVLATSSIPDETKVCAHHPIDMRPVTPNSRNRLCPGFWSLATEEVKSFVRCSGLPFRGYAPTVLLQEIFGNLSSNRRPVLRLLCFTPDLVVGCAVPMAPHLCWLAFGEYQTGILRSRRLS